MKNKLILAVSLLALGAAAPVLAQQAQAPANTGPIPAQRMGSWGFDVSGMDRSVRPGANFFDFANGAWARRTQIPADRSSFGAFHVLGELSENRVRRLVEGYQLGQPGDRGKVAALYRSFLDEARVEQLGAQPLQPLLQRVRAAQSRDQIAELMGRSAGSIGASFFGIGVNDDQRNPDIYALSMGQSGLGLPDRDYYLNERFSAQKARYQQYVAQMLGLAGWENAEAAAQAIVAMETRIAEAHWDRAQSRNRDRTYNPVTLAELEAQAPNFPWRTYFRAAGIDNPERVILRQNTAIPRLAQIFAETDPATLRAWYAFHTADRSAPLLSRAFVDAQFDFRSRFLQGQPQQRDRWKRAIGFAEGAMGEAIG
ncbi:MAG TPA: M13 family metallopeptidase N-terminal domain-containing protein, partial [Sphingomicrobium sp.]|nr:M13 family metallopeptidase N-terminal domain-containing protein [Sphingomicrobium sp.]